MNCKIRNQRISHVKALICRNYFHFEALKKSQTTDQDGGLSKPQLQQHEIKSEQVKDETTYCF